MTRQSDEARPAARTGMGVGARGAAAALAIAGLGGALGGCATTPPDVTVHYYFPKAETQLVVTETVGCSPKPPADKPGHRLIRAVMTVAPTTTNSADVAWARQGSIRYRDYSSTFSDEDVSITLTADGRLSGINASSTGEGDAIVKNLVTVAGSLAALGGGARVVIPPQTIDDACAVVDQYAAISTADPAKVAPTVTFTYAVAFTYDFGADGRTPTLSVDKDAFPGYANAPAQSAAIDLAPDPVWAKVVSDLEGKLPGRFTPRVQLLTTGAGMKYIHTAQPPADVTAPFIELPQVARLDLQMQGYVGDLQGKAQVWANTVPAPTHELYRLPAPPPATFGKTAFGLALSDYGSITTLHYGMNSPLGDSADAANAVAKALAPKSTADRASELKAQADLIAQQQRLVACEVDAKSCK